MPRAATVRLTAMLAAVLAMSGCDPNVSTPAEASQRVRDSYAWMADAELCPADLMPARPRVDGLADLSCADAKLPGCFTRCRKGDVDSCYWLANTLEHADSGDVAAQALYQRACMLGEPSGCTNRAATMFLGDRRDAGIMQCAARTFERTCGLHDAWGCAMLGNALHEGLGVSRDDTRALTVLAEACRRSDDAAPACHAARQLTEVIRQSTAGASGAGGP